MDADFVSSLAYRRALVDTLRRDRNLHSDRVAAALLAVPREAFVPGVPLDEVYRPSEAIVVKRVEGMSVSSASAPEVIALMLEQLDPRPRDHVLEIGAGTGYNAALLAHMVGETGQVVTVDIDEDLVEAARVHLDSAGYSQVKVVQGDGALGYPAAQPYDRITLTVASADIAPAWHAQLARPHGRLVMPLILRGLQRCLAFTAAGPDGCLRSDSLRMCSFISMRGMLDTGGPRGSIGTLFVGDGGAPPLIELIADLLPEPLRAWPTGISTSLDQVRQGMHLWLAAREPELYTVWGGGQIPDLFGLTDRVPEARGTLALLDAANARLALLAWGTPGVYSGELYVLAPLSADVHAQRLVSLVSDWARAGRPMDAFAAIRACPRPNAERPGPSEVELDRRWTRFLVSWAQPPASLTE
jgi:protein-L-isoaspartate(D-aspartate) O-methyltransferase